MPYARNIPPLSCLTMLATLVVTAIMSLPASGETRPRKDAVVLFSAADAAHRVGTARKTKLVQARPATEGEIIITKVPGEKEAETKNTAKAGDMVVRNTCFKTDNEEYIVSAEKFAKRYEGPIGDPVDGWSEYRPLGPEMRYFIVDETEGAFVFTAPWGEDMIANPGDAIVQNPSKPADTYRVAAGAFDCTYEILKAPQ